MKCLLGLVNEVAKVEGRVTSRMFDLVNNAKKRSMETREKSYTTYKPPSVWRPPVLGQLSFELLLSLLLLPLSIAVYFREESSNANEK